MEIAKPISCKKFKLSGVAQPLSDLLYSTANVVQYDAFLPGDRAMTEPERVSQSGWSVVEHPLDH